ncbi:ATP-binding protein [Lachnospiraceae bacterium ZAX-1]
MKIKNKETLLYALILIFSALLLVFSLHSYTNPADEEAGIVIPILDIVFMDMGLIYFGIAAMMVWGMWGYYIGKIFSVQLFLTAIALLADFYIGDMAGWPRNVLLIAGNICMLCVIARITGLHQGKAFKILISLYSILSVAQMAYSVAENAKKTGAGFLFANYMLAFLAVIGLFGCSYQYVSECLKKQMKALMKSLTIGMLLYVILLSVNIIEISSPHENEIRFFQSTSTWEETKDEPETFMGIQLNENTSLPAIAFAIVTFRILFMMIKKEYFVSEVAYWIHKTVKSIILLMVFNVIAAIHFNGSVIGIFMVNGILVWVMAGSGYKSPAGKHQNEIAVLEEGKHTLAMYLHDEILQDVFVIKNTVNIDQNAEEKLAALVGKIRKLSNDLFPLIVENIGLNRSLELYVDELRRNHNIEFDYVYNCPQTVMELNLETVFYRSVKELVNNAVKHAKATMISVVIESDQSDLWATVRDNGVGFEVPEIKDLIMKKSMGMYSIYKQSRDLGGQFKLYSSLGNGTTCTVKLPL